MAAGNAARAAARTARNSDRQHAISYAGGIAKWAEKVMVIYRQNAEARDNRKPKEERAKLMADAANELILLYDQAGLVIAKNDGATINEVLSLIRLMTADHGAILSNHDLKSVEVYDESRIRFVNAVREDIGIGRQHFDAQKYLQ